jgi:hypothetical protein
MPVLLGRCVRVAHHAASPLRHRFFRVGLEICAAPAAQAGHAGRFYVGDAASRLSFTSRSAHHVAAGERDSACALTASPAAPRAPAPRGKDAPGRASARLAHPCGCTTGRCAQVAEGGGTSGGPACNSRQAALCSQVRPYRRGGRTHLHTRRATRRRQQRVCVPCRRRRAFSACATLARASCSRSALARLGGTPAQRRAGLHPARSAWSVRARSLRLLLCDHGGAGCRGRARCTWRGCPASGRAAVAGAACVGPCSGRASLQLLPEPPASGLSAALRSCGCCARALYRASQHRRRRQDPSLDVQADGG